MEKPKREFICFAHRGASGHEPENTLLAIEKALSMGAPWIEIDVFCVEGELVVIHDERLEYTTSGRGYVTEKTLAHLRTLDAGKGQRIPLLRAELASRAQAARGAAPLPLLDGASVTIGHNPG